MKKGLITPIVITICKVLFYAFFALLTVVFIIIGDIGFWIWVAWLAVMAVSIGISVLVLAERIKEIRSGEEDDLSKY